MSVMSDVSLPLYMQVRESMTSEELTELLRRRPVGDTCKEVLKFFEMAILLCLVTKTFFFM
jgi:hypothetical protein